MERRQSNRAATLQGKSKIFNADTDLGPEPEFGHRRLRPRCPHLGEVSRRFKVL